MLLTKTAESLDDIALKILFVSVQQNNLELCLAHAVKQYAFDILHNITADTDSSLNFGKNMVCPVLIQMWLFYMYLRRVMGFMTACNGLAMHVYV